ncbi:MAG: hypothetical protein F4X83_09800 [Chloroflexi bacterium]|nr:hypothetical protein [Chloroflexota bacterium]
MSAQKVHQTVLGTGEGSWPDGRWRIGLKDLQFLGRTRSEVRFDARLHELETQLASHDWKVRCLSQQIEESDSPYWPAREVALLVEVDDLVDHWVQILEELLSITVQHLDNDWPFSVVPVMNGQVLSALATVPTSFIPLPDQDFSRKWATSLDRPSFSSTLLEKF